MKRLGKTVPRQHPPPPMSTSSYCTSYMSTSYAIRLPIHHTADISPACKRVSQDVALVLAPRGPSIDQRSGHYMGSALGRPEPRTRQLRAELARRRVQKL